MTRARNTLGILALALWVTAGGLSAAPTNEIATMSSGPSAIEWSAAGSGAVLNIAGPGGFYLSRELAAGETARFGLFDAEGSARADGVYSYELRAVVVLDDATRAELEPMRSDPGFDAVLAAKTGLTNRYQSGSFAIVDGALVLPGAEEERPAAGDRNELGRKVVLTNANGVIRNALCVGFDCPDNPAFGDSSVLMMENNNRIKFGDTSVSPFPLNDWEIEANSNLSGGASYLAFNDCGTSDNDGGCTTDLVFGVEAGARQRALWVDSAGDVGVGTATPVTEMHLVRGDSPTLRLDQDASSGFQPQVWDVVGNETSFFVRDASNGSTLPFRIRPGSASNALVIDVDSQVGVGVLSPERPLDVVATGAPDNTVLEIENNGAARMRIRNGSSGETWNIGHQLPSQTGLTFSDVGDADSELLLDVDGNLTITGTLTTGGGTCGGGGCDLVFDPETERTPLVEHAAAMWTNGHLPAVGPTPENQPFNLTHKVGGMLHELEMAHIYIEELHGALEVKSREVAELRSRLERQESEDDGEVAELRARLERLEAALAGGTE